MAENSIHDADALREERQAKPGLDDHRKRTLFRAWHRGMREMDLIFGRFADLELADMSAADLADFEVLMEEPDGEVYDWLTGRKPVPDAFVTPVFERIRQFGHI